MIVVSDSSPIMNLAAVGQLDLLQQLYGTIHIPGAVYSEIAIAGAGRPGASEVQTLAWVKLRNVSNQALIRSLEVELDPGEAETLALAIEVQAELVLLDERKARLVAARMGVPFVGLLAVLVEAKHNRLITTVKRVMDALIIESGFWIAEGLYAQVLRSAGE